MMSKNSSSMGVGGLFNRLLVYFVNVIIVLGRCVNKTIHMPFI